MLLLGKVNHARSDFDLAGVPACWVETMYAIEVKDLVKSYGGITAVKG
jgi:hypothetical protein